MKEFRVSDIDTQVSSRIIKSAVTPRPIGWISTTSADGVDNLAPFSCYNYISSDYPVVMFSSKVKQGGKPKDTAWNVANTGEFVVNVVTERLAEQMDQTSAELPADESEFDFARLERADSTHVTPPRVADALISLECTNIESLDIHDRAVFFGEVETFHIDDEVLVNGKVEMDHLDTVGRLGGPYYTSVNRMELTREF
ncbi:flavin reductase family protein [Halalkalicoccus jeotgali]|uniref:Flavin reductase domain protein FMN-binding protein n=1 Tax=Halalkalicoccus jeotgali (strain DSM 18796 / CECT 7217 / JCM 14584 / KCTC 4019 / B3) TaxID=795797 RepID=D8JCU7_HALJB|nr:flavin reductase family protein [Halalkalicoccus jeotgali]ADJ16842.1 flavin reductase domain protein FMN-binding protein [Halalkalicoccus jeotgali B3]ELY38722.1 flavin reductase domain protein FMN-binding protein [Halalkalicoccus jeotgali B3]